MKQIKLKLFLFLTSFLFIISCEKEKVSMNKALPLVIAHRGASGYLPEHTLEAKAYAYALGAHYLEQDIVLTKDNIPIIMHDPEIDTTTNVAEIFPERARKDGRYYSVDFTLREIKSLKLSERFDPKTGNPIYPNRFPLNEYNSKIPTLEEEIQFIQGLNKSTGKNVGIYPEIKKPFWHKQQGKDISKIVIEILHKYGYKSKEDKIYLQIFDFDELKRIREELDYKGKLVMLIGENDWDEAPTDYEYIKSEEGIAEVAKYSDGIGPWIPQVIIDGKVTGLISLAHKHKMEVHPYTMRIDALPSYVKNANELLNLLFNKAKVDGVFTDFPDVVLGFIRK
uniref:glycerophosphodiester phosphodiesterase n=13 Tax=unclassified Borrelia TaxID=2649934 RepID=H1A8W5_9SPIR|nr:glycerophosphodiester phosphodiesterase [Borrelia sp. tAG66M]BAL46124.1 glycerophosphodiester phosphodiesterase [Borrelia sp. tAG442M]BAL46125.1 glycerophosphodiester phosphodiesterase [Borrelia sp. tAG444M]BAL46126.1 glycerophosphodiester phosphodiesterase [Borrelia sp. tAG445M]BAL46129.1 glycerophosphodiester phosphodiesterase [Borrelia sp. tAG449M]BAL46130.1 glycerophosphodiester phosphodiesterase [Borrelia sp. tAG452M]BAL46131.1 glycerophosphodiester phosphodiesterase [Borrelia sp. tAG